MAPKGKNDASGAGTKRSRKGTTSISSSRAPTYLPPQKFVKQMVMHYGEEWYDCQQEAKYMGDENVLEGQWDRVRDMGQHSTLHYAHLKIEPGVWLKIGLPVNAGAILRQNMIKFRTNKRWSFLYGSLLTRYLRALEIEEEVYDVYPPRAPHLVYHLVDVTKTKAHNPSQGKVLSTSDRQAEDDSLECMALPSFSCGFVMGPTFQVPIDDDNATDDEEHESNDVGPSDDDTDAGAGDVRGANPPGAFWGDVFAKKWFN
ncbi:hypothetical protein H5410_002870 [Solanum commersonii]|uniref:Uncharacterized protein n=1 Tax=Solanum commersonii TaxID=4109 RepID=A0A9J6B374_SOLCO|nr:hypothetical protein H5410_002870 [Solanum commersonii]